MPAEIAERGYARPESLVTMGWVVDHLRQPGVKIVEVDVDTAAYEDGHSPGASGWDRQSQSRSRERIAATLLRVGHAPRFAGR